MKGVRFPYPLGWRLVRGAGLAVARSVLCPFECSTTVTAAVKSLIGGAMDISNEGYRCERAIAPGVETGPVPREER